MIRSRTIRPSPLHPAMGIAAQDLAVLRLPGAWIEERLDPLLLLAAAFCVVPAMACLYIGRPTWSALWLFGWVMVLLGRYFLRGQVTRYLTLATACLPALLLLKQFFFLHCLVGVFGGGLVMCYLLQPRQFAHVWRVMGSWFIVGGAYWFISFLSTGQYYANSRVFELLFSAAAFVLLAQKPKYLATALTGVLLSVLAMSVAFLPYVGRLGMGFIGGYWIGNPVSLGVPLSLIFLLLFADQGQRLLLDRRPAWRVPLMLATGLFLLLSTSRASWAVTLISTMVLLTRRQSKNRLLLIGTLALLVTCGVVFLSKTPWAGQLSRSLDKTFSSDESMLKRSNGRSDQWRLFPHVLGASPLWGHGPGQSPAAYAKYSARHPWVQYQPGRPVAWHALLLHVGVELGLLGLATIAFLIIPLARQGLRNWSRTGDAIPFLAVIAFMVITGTVSGFDGVSGLYLGLALTSRAGQCPPR